MAAKAGFPLAAWLFLAAVTGAVAAPDSTTNLRPADLVDRGLASYRSEKYEDALRWFRQAADQGSAPAEYQIGEMYELARGVPEDMAQAMVWYRKAADQRYPAAEVAVGTLYANGWGVSRDESQALIWYRKAADQGYAVAQESVGIAYTNGLGVAPDFAEARAWLDRAIAGGNTEAELYLCPPYQEAWIRAFASKDSAKMDRVIAKIDPNCGDLLRDAKAERAKLGRAAGDR
jgi:TPR repeat protein